jgi:hypothetical protein
MGEIIRMAGVKMAGRLFASPRVIHIARGGIDGARFAERS